MLRLARVALPICLGEFQSTPLGLHRSDWLRFYDGFELLQKTGVHVAPGVGELFEYPIVTIGNKRKTVLFFFSANGGPFEALIKTSFTKDPAVYNKLVLDVLANHFAMPLTLLTQEIRFGSILLKNSGRELA